ncbi:MAG: hypothetical protein JEZ09_08785 [Salinivirgaceae bacterium]|nr:hypothetical protein [Salinivirgaceae bacterium]
MKKNILITIGILLLIQVAYSQIAYYDATSLKSQSKLSNGKVKINANSTTYGILCHYTKEKKNEKKYLLDQFKYNPFIEFDTDGSPQSGNFITKSEELGFNLGKLDFSNFSQGLSMIIIEGAKQELNIAFFDRFKNYVDKNEEIKILFPLTTYRLGNLISYNYNMMLPQLREAFNKDLSNLPDNTIKILEEGEEFKKLNQLIEFKLALNSIKLVRELEFNSPPEFINRLPDITIGIRDSMVKNKRDYDNFLAALHLTKIFSNSLRNKNPDQNWVNSKDVYSNVLKNTLAFNLYMGLIYQNIKNNETELKINDKLLTELLNNNEISINWYNGKIYELISLTDQIDKAYLDITKKQNNGIKIDNNAIYTYVNTSLDITDFGLNIVNHYSPISSKANIYLAYSKQANNIYKYTFQKEYSSAILSLTDLLQNVMKQTPDFKEKNYKWLYSLTLYGTFMANMIDAKSPEDISSIISGVALPAGSSSIKKYADVNVSISSYLGPNYKINYESDKSINAWNSQWTLTAPVGITVSTGFKKGGSLTLMGVLIDVGAIVDFQLKGDTLQYVENTITLANIFSLGAYLFYGFPIDLPLSIGIGGQYGPGLSEVGNENIAIANPSNWRFGFSVVIDIPIVNIYNKPKI